MYCPQCATDNLDSASFCRGCGANISMVSQALTGTLQTNEASELDDTSSRRRRRRGRGRDEPSIEKGIKNIFMGLAFVFVAFAARRYMPGAFTWWFWLFIPAFSMLGGGVAEVFKYKMKKDAALPAATQSPALPAGFPRPSALPRRNTAELIPQPPSITEGTTRHLGGEMPTRHFEIPVESEPKKL